jgi:alpha-aminoadipate carrier protein LysW
MSPPLVTPCPVCDAEVRLSQDTVVSELVVCDSCSSPLEVRTVDPLQLAEAPQEEEDWGQ